jgi:hypothetical protein
MLCTSCVLYTAISIFQSGYRKSIKYDNGVIAYLSVFLIAVIAFLGLGYWKYSDESRDVVVGMTGYIQDGAMSLLMISFLVQLQIFSEFIQIPKAMRLLSMTARVILILSCVILMQAWIGVLGILSGWYQSLNLTEAQVTEHYWLACWITMLTILSCLVAFSSWVAMRNALQSAAEGNKPKILQDSNKQEELTAP